MVQSFVSSDCIVDCIHDFWKNHGHRFNKVKKILLNLDNGGENSSRRTQFMKRMVDFVNITKIEVELAYYPPYHSKYNPIERVWGVLEKHWNGDLLDSVDTVINFAKTMTYNGIHPIVKLIKQTYNTGVKLVKKEMMSLEKCFIRLTNLEKWSVLIPYKIKYCMAI